MMMMMMMMRGFKFSVKKFSKIMEFTPGKMNSQIFWLKI
jgi:hypothetical protein